MSCSHLPEQNDHQDGRAGYDRRAGGGRELQRMGEGLAGCKQQFAAGLVREPVTCVDLSEYAGD